MSETELFIQRERLAVIETKIQSIEKDSKEVKNLIKELSFDVRKAMEDKVDKAELEKYQQKNDLLHEEHSRRHSKILWTFITTGISFITALILIIISIK